jgi:hypothetical protein
MSSKVKNSTKNTRGNRPVILSTQINENLKIKIQEISNIGEVKISFSELLVIPSIL